MVRMVKGAKWTYGWVVVSADRRIEIPPEAWQAYGFACGDEAVFSRGSSTSGGFAITTPSLLVSACSKMNGAALADRAASGGTTVEFGKSRFADGWVSLPPTVRAEPGDRLLAVRGSRWALAFVARGRIYREAMKHPELEVFDLGRPGSAESGG